MPNPRNPEARIHAEAEDTKLTAVDTSLQAAQAALGDSRRSHRTATGVALSVIDGAGATDGGSDVVLDRAMDRVLDAARDRNDEFPPLLHQMEYIAILLVRRGLKITKARLDRINPTHRNSCARCGARKLRDAVSWQYVERHMLVGDYAHITTSWGERHVIDPNEADDLEKLFNELLTRVRQDEDAHFSIRVGQHGRRSRSRSS